ncbi:MAG: hypothetical protein ABFC92_03460 [Rectinema sp.]|jgi:hypothetical protein
MKFLVKRTSFWDNKKPCDEAKEEDVKLWGESTEAWVIEISSLEELLDFVNKYGDLIISTGATEPTFKIEIYDDYRE